MLFRSRGREGGKKERHIEWPYSYCYFENVPIVSGRGETPGCCNGLAVTGLVTGAVGFELRPAWSRSGCGGEPRWGYEV